ncbi:MAG: hypothetical protein KF724_06265 [Phycisphaeraceae bacterium]|nr:hypothetical protein [Phycisphaeraceae bacterium]
MPATQIMPPASAAWKIDIEGGGPTLTRGSGNSSDLGGSPAGENTQWGLRPC